MGFATDAIHAGVVPDPATGSVMTPIYQTSTYVYESPGKSTGYDYARTINPTRSALEANLRVLEGGKAAYAFASGMAAISAVMTLVKAGDHVVVSHNVYGGTYRLFARVLEDYGLAFTYVDTSMIENIERAVRKTTRMVYVETPTNPIMILTDIALVARLCRERGLISVVDNTFLTPYLQRPLDLGADIVVHSTTKYLNGHSDSVGGAAILTRDEHAERIKFVQNSVGAILSPFDSWLVLRGTKTLALRMPRHEENGRVVARFLRKQPKVRKVYWPGFSDHPGHEVHRRQATGFGSMISFDLGSLEAAQRLLKTVRLCSLAESLGGVETLISHPATMTHAGYTQAERDALGIGQGLVRISVGCEDAEDLLADLRRALEAV